MSELHKHNRPTPVPEAPAIPTRLRMMTTHELALTAITGLEETRGLFVAYESNARERAKKREEEYTKREAARDKVLGALATGFQELSQAQKLQANALLQLTAQHTDRLRGEHEIRELIGKPPKELQKRQSSSDLSPEALEELKTGTGLAGVVGRLVADQYSTAKKVSVAAGLTGLLGSSPVWVPAAIDTISKLF